ncbi:zinc ribbon domain-containing protein, partial [Streptomyces noursei]
GSNPAPGTGHNARKYLLRGTLRCDRDGCSTPLRVMKAEKSRNKPEGYFYYVCPSKGSSPAGCGGTKIAGPETDKVVSMMVIAKHQEQQAKHEAVPAVLTWDREDELARVREDIDDLKSARRSRTITAETYFAQLAQHEAEKRQLISARNKVQRQQAAAKSAPVDLAAEWNSLMLSEKRGYVEDMLLAVLVSPAVGRGRPVRDRLEPVWRPKGEQAQGDSP